ncbi:hypothetical protein [Georgenia sp. H159]|nr:hypothetical protein [Georgenia sp. H159]
MEQTQLLKNPARAGAALMVLGLFTGAGHDLRLALAGPLLDLG